MHKRHLLKSKMTSTYDPLSWEHYKHAQNHSNSDIGKAK